jgi:hypothetical protein
MRSTLSRSRLDSTCRLIRSGASPVSPGVPVVEWKTFVVIAGDALRSRHHSPIHDSLLPPP